MVNPTRRFALWLLLSVLICLTVAIPAFALPAMPKSTAKPAPTPAPAPPAPPAAPFFPLTLTNGGVQVRILDAKWAWPDALSGISYPSGITSDSQIPLLAVWYDISPNPDPGDPHDPPLLPRIVLQTPAGDQEGTQSLDPNHGPDARCALWSNVDPRQPVLTLRLDALRPDAPPDASGKTVQDVTFTNLPLPVGVGPAVTVNRTQTAANGTTVTVDNLSEIQPNALGDGALLMPQPLSFLTVNGHWTRPWNHPDLCITFDQDLWDFQQTGEPILKDDAGEDLVEQGWADDWPLHDGFSIQSPVPGPSAIFATLHVRLHEQGGSLQDPSAILHFPFSLPSAQIGMPTRRPAAIPATPIASTALGGDTLMVEKITYASRLPNSPGWHVWLHLTVPKPQTSGDEWQGAMREISTGLASSTPYENIGPETDWAADGSLLPPNEKRFDLQIGQEMHGSLFGPLLPVSPPPSKFDLTLDWREVVSQTQLLTFQAIPLPAPGTVSQMNRTMSAGTIGNFVLRKVGWYDLNNPQDQDKYQGRPNSDFMLPPTGLVVVIQCPAGETLGTANEFLGPDPLLALDFSDARDDRGVPLLWPDMLFDYDRSNRTVDSDMLTKSGGAVPNAITLFLLPPPPGAKYFRFDLRATERHALNSATTTFSALPLPPLPKD